MKHLLINRRTLLAQVALLGCLPYSTCRFILPAFANQPRTYLRDAQIEAFLQDALNPITRPLGYNLNDFRFVIIQDPSINAFVIPGNYIFIHTGLLRAMTNVTSVQAVLAHEFGHYHAGHITRASINQKSVLTGALAGALLSIPLALLTTPEAAIASVSAALGIGELDRLRYSRDLESEADFLALKFLEQANIPATALSESLETMQQLSFGNFLADRYFLTHPLTDERILKAQLFTRNLKQENLSPTLLQYDLRVQFSMIKAKLRGYLELPLDVLERLDAKPTPYEKIAGAVAAMRAFQHKRAISLGKEIIQDFPDTPYSRELFADILYKAGHFHEAHNLFSQVQETIGGHPLIFYSWLRNINSGEINIARQDIETRLQTIIHQEHIMIAFWHELARYYHLLGEIPLRDLYFAEAAIRQNQPQEAHRRLKPHLHHFRKPHHQQRARDILWQAEQDMNKP